MSNGFIGPLRSDTGGIYGSPWGDIRDVGGGLGSILGTAGTGAEGGAATTALPSWIIPIAISLLQTLFKKSPEDEAQDLKNQMATLGIKAPYQSPYLSQIDPVVLKALLAQMARTSNWGWPAGKGMDTSFIENALQNIRTGGVRLKQTGGILGG